MRPCVAANDRQLRLRPLIPPCDVDAGIVVLRVVVVVEPEVRLGLLLYVPVPAINRFKKRALAMSGGRFVGKRTQGQRGRTGNGQRQAVGDCGHLR